MTDTAVDRCLAVTGVSRREFLRRVAVIGAVAGMGSILEACATATQSASPTVTRTPEPRATPAAPTPEPAPIPTPERELAIYNWDGYIGQETVAKFEKQYAIKIRYDNFVDEQEQIDKLKSDGRGGGYDITYPRSTWLPSFVADGLVQPIAPTLVPNLANLAPVWQSPGYDPGNRYSVPNYWWTSGYAWDPTKLSTEFTTWADLWDPSLAGRLAMLNDMREVFAAAAFQLGLSPNTTDEAELDQILARLQALKPLVRTWTDDAVGDFESGDVWITHCSSRDWSGMTVDAPDTKYVIPAEGSIRGNDAMVILSGAKHPIAAHLWINFNLDPAVSAANTNYVGYMSPNAAALPLIDDAIKGDPRLNPPADVQAKLVGLTSLAPADLDKYRSRWKALRA